MAIGDKIENKSKSVAFKEDVQECDDHIEDDVGENLTEFTVLLTKSFSKFVRRLDKISRINVIKNVKDNQHWNFKVSNFKRKGKDG